MTERQIRSFAQLHGLKIEKRITTGNDQRHFATFEVFPEEPPPAGPNVLEAWRKAQQQEDPNRLKGENPLTLFHARSDTNGLPWIEFDSVWCDDGSRV